MNKKIIKDFYEGNVKLWRSFWFVGIAHAFVLFFFLPIIDKILFNNNNIYNYVQVEDNIVQVPNFIKLSIFSKLIIILSTTYITIGIWRSAEKYTGNFFWIFLTFFYLAFNNILPTIYLILNLFN